MQCNHIMKKVKIYLMTLIALFTLTSCKQEPGLVNEETEPKENVPSWLNCEKDGEINYYCYYSMQADSIKDVYRRPPFDSLKISEHLHKVDMKNAIPFSVKPGESITFQFFGRFFNMPEYMFIWTKELVERPTYSYYSTLINRLKVYQNLAIIASSGNVLETVHGYLFMVDTDERHSGDGVLLITTDTKIDTFFINAQKHTVNIGENSRSLQLNMPVGWHYLQIESRDFESYATTNDQAIVLLHSTHSDIEDVEFFSGAASSPTAKSNNNTTDNFTLTGFVPIFYSQQGDLNEQ